MARENPTCTTCGVALVVGENWYECLAVNNRYCCKRCYKERAYAHSRSLTCLYGLLKARASGSGGRYKVVPFDLTLDEYAKIRQMPCHYCGGPLPEAGCGVDQKVAGVGYTAENALPCCELCNMAKSDLISYEQAVKFIGPAIRALRKECEENGTPPPSRASRPNKFRKRKPTTPTQQVT